MITQVVSGIIEDGKGSVLLARRPAGKRLEGLWEFPGGKKEGEEEFEQALLRELQEELKLDVRLNRKLGKFRFKYEWGTIDLHVFVVSALNEPQVTQDVHEFKWIRPHQITPAELTPADVKPLSQYLRLSRLR